MASTDKFSTPGQFWLSASEVANNLNIISDLLTITINATNSKDPAIKIIVNKFKDQLLEKVNLT